MNGGPRVSVVLPVFNAAAYVAETLQSLLDQTFTDFEIIAINDGSTDRSGEIIRDTMKNDARLRLVEHENRGLVAVLNEGLQLARGEYVARLDADDVALPQRFAKQVAWLDANPDVAVLGSSIETFSPRDATKITYPTDPAAIAAMLIFRNPIAHPAVMMRKRALEAHGLKYENPYRCAQDNFLWVRCTEHGLAIANFPEVLTRYRLHGGQLTQQQSAATRAEGVAIRLHLLRLLLPPSAEEHALHEALALNELVPEETFIRDAASWLTKLAATNEYRRFFQREAFEKVLTGRFVALHRFARGNGLAPPDVAASPFENHLHADAL